MKKIYFVRHGQSEWNVADRICGRYDAPLTEKGHQQAILTGEKILEAGIKADMIVSSPLLRAADTAREISRITGIPMEIKEGLIEQNFGKWEGTSPRSNPDFTEQKRQFINSYGGGETMLKLAQRIYNVLDELKEDDKIYIIVAHNGIARVVKSYFHEMTNEEYSSFGVRNCEIQEFEFV